MEEKDTNITPKSKDSNNKEAGIRTRYPTALSHQNKYSSHSTFLVSLLPADPHQCVQYLLIITVSPHI